MPGVNNRYSLIIYSIISILILLLTFIVFQSNQQITDSGAATADEYIRVSGKNLVYKNQNIQLLGANAHNIEALCSRYGPSNFGSCNINDIRLSEADYQKLGEDGGNHFRFGMAYRWYQDNPSLMFQVLDQHIAWARKHNIWIILNVFTLPGDCYEGYTVQSCPFWTNSTYKQQLKDFWTAIATRYKDEPVIAGYDLINEPYPGSGGYTLWKNYAQEVRDALWVVDKNHPIYFMALSDPQFPSKLSGENIIYEVHDYLPMAMSHSSTPTAYPGISNEWCGTVLWSQKTITGQSDTFNGTTYPSNSCNNIGTRMSLTWANSNNVPILVGEWGSQKFGNFNGAYNYHRDRGLAYKDLYQVNHSFYSWKHSKDNWGLYPNVKNNSAEEMVPHYQSMLDSIKLSWAGAIRPSFTTTTLPTFVCGNGILESGEVCDDGNTSNNDQCSSNCLNSCTIPFVWNGSSCIDTTPIQQLPFNGVVSTLPKKIEAEDFDNGGQGIAYNDTTPNENEATTYAEGSNYRDSGVDIKLSSNNRNVVGYTTSGEWLEYTLSNPVSQTYDLKVFGGSTSAGKRISFSWNGTSVVTVTLPQILNWSSHQEVTVNDISIPSGDGVLRVTWDDSSSDLDWFEFTTVVNLPAGCKGDYNVSGTLDIQDFGVFGSNYKQSGIDCALDILNNDCYLNIVDFQEFGRLYKQNNACI